MFLSDDEVRQLTEYERPADQRRWLQSHGYIFAVGARGRPKVARKEALRHLYGGDVEPTGSEPDWRHLP